ncbi:MAG: PEP-utilizing enzyme [Candidatus Pacearchaeota archaeon]|nr:PEP-utilizing enzyme [Candidatus Pacearchaeota archaeon]
MQEGEKKEILSELKELSNTDSNEKEFVKWFSELNKNSIELAGEKGANLSEISNLNIETPPGFVVTSNAYDYFLDSADIREKIKEILNGLDFEKRALVEKRGKEIEELILKAEFPTDLEEEILESYEHLDAHDLDLTNKSALDILNNASEPIFVAVRPSVVVKNVQERVLSGQNEAFTNVKGKKELIFHVKKCFASLFTLRAIFQRGKIESLPKMGVVVQKMVDSEKSGVMFSRDPVTNQENTVIEAIFGMGEGISLGRVNADLYKVNYDQKIISQKIAIKKIAINRNSAGDRIVTKLQESKSKSQVLANHEIRKLNDIVLRLEAHFKEPQFIEFAIDKEDIFILQARGMPKLEEIEEQNINDTVLISGVAGSRGIAFGKVRVVDNEERVKEVKEKEIVVCSSPFLELMSVLDKISGLICERGSLGSNVVTALRQMGIACVIGLENAVVSLKEGEMITVDGFDGKVYRGKVAQNTFEEVAKVEKTTRTNLKLIVDSPRFAQHAIKTGIKQVGLVRLEKIIADNKIHPHYFLEQGKIKEYEDLIKESLQIIAEPFEEVWIRTSDILSNKLNNLKGSPKEIETNPFIGMHGTRYSLKYPQILKAELNAIKGLDSEKSIGVLLPNVIFIEEIKRVKEMIRELDFNVKVGVIIETPVAVQMMRDICELGVDVVSFNVSNLVQHILAIDKENPDLSEMYKENHFAVLNQLEYAIRVCKRFDVKVNVFEKPSEELVKFFVKKDVNSINVEPEEAKRLSDYITEIEKPPVEEQPRQYQPGTE